MTKRDMLYILKLRMLYLTQLGKHEAAEELGYLRMCLSRQTEDACIRQFSEQLGIQKLSVAQRMEMGLDR